MWMRPHASGEFYECIAIYVDDLAIAMEDPEKFTQEILIDKFKFKLKGTGVLAFLAAGPLPAPAAVSRPATIVLRRCGERAAGSGREAPANLGQGTPIMIRGNLKHA